MSNAKQIANELITRAKACYPEALEVDHRELTAYLEGAPYDATAVRVELGYAADYRERLGAYLAFGYLGDYSVGSWQILAKTH